MCNRRPSDELKVLSIHVYKLSSRFMVRFKHHSRNYSVLLDKNIDQGPLKE